jgi:all-trans-retinol dehydrogenase (NAD+)
MGQLEGAMNLSGQVAVVTGAGRGIGLATARRLCAAGCRVAVWDTDEAALRAASDGLSAISQSITGGAVLTQRVDVTRPEEIAAAVAEVESALGPVDILVNNAGIFRPGSFLDRPVAEWASTFSVNLNAVAYVTHAVLPGMYQRNRGHIVNISSAAGLLGVPEMTVYSATKWGVLGFTESLRHEARNRGSAVRVSSVHPMYVTTGLFEGAKLKGIGAIVVPQVKNHDTVAEAVVESALRRGKWMVLRPRSLRLAILLRGILPYRLFLLSVRLFGVHVSMQTWHGSGGESQDGGVAQ